MVSKIIPCILQLCELLDSFADKQNGKQLNQLQKVTTDLALRIRINLEAITPHFEKFDRGYMNESLPIALILRSVVSDIITFCYLGVFFNTESDPKDQPSLDNELNLLDKDIIKSFEQVMDLEKEMGKIIPALPKDLTEEKVNEIKNKIRKQFKDLFRENGQFKSPEEIRSSSLAKYFAEGERTLVLTERSKADKIANYSILDKFSVAYNMFKYFSQFQHYSRFTLYLMQKETERNSFYFTVTIDLVYMMYILYFQLIDPKDEGGYLAILQKERAMFEKQIS